jgi:hypothetical protein
MRGRECRGAYSVTGGDDELRGGQIIHGHCTSPTHRTASNRIIYNIRDSPLFHCSSLSSFLPSSSTRHMLLHSSDEQVVVVGP